MRALAVVMDVKFELPKTAYGIVSLPGRSPSPAARAFAQVLRDVEAELRQREDKLAAAIATGRSQRQRAS